MFSPRLLVLLVCTTLLLSAVAAADEASSGTGSSDAGSATSTPSSGGGSSDGSAGTTDSSGSGSSDSGSGSSDSGTPAPTDSPAPTESPEPETSPVPEESPFPTETPVSSPSPEDTFTPAPPPPPPPGCREVKDESGVVRVECDRQAACPSPPPDAESKCSEAGGSFERSSDERGCERTFCSFSQGTFNPISGGGGACPSEEEERKNADICREKGGNPIFQRAGECNVFSCRFDRHEEPEFACRHITQKEDEILREGCAKDGRRTIEEFDNNGCRNLRCAAPGQEGREGPRGPRERGEGEESFCPRQLPKQAYDRCADKGGDLVIDRDEQGCIAFQECVFRGHEDDVFVRQDEVQRVPDATVLLDMAFKLEELKIKFLELSKKTEGIAEYYSSLGSDDENRFRTVSNMFEAAADQVDEVRAKLRSRLQDLSTDDLVEIKYDIKNLVDVTLKDIVFFMLGSDDNAEIRQLKRPKAEPVAEEPGTEPAEGVKRCGNNGLCFDKSVRRCTPATFDPEGRSGPTITIKGVEDGKCAIRVENKPGQSPPGFKAGQFSMTCRVEKFAKGIRGPLDMMGGTDLPFCEGPMADFLRRNPEFLQDIEERGGPPEDFEDFEDEGFRRPQRGPGFESPESGGFERPAGGEFRRPRTGPGFESPGTDDGFKTETGPGFVSPGTDGSSRTSVGPGFVSPGEDRG